MTLKEREMLLLNAECEHIAKKLGFTKSLRPCKYRAFYDYEQRNAKGERLTIEVSYCEGVTLPEKWRKAGDTKELITEWWGVHCYVTDTEGMCFEAYNPTTKLSDDGHRFVVNFDWHLKATSSNFKKLLEEIKRQFNTEG